MAYATSADVEARLGRALTDKEIEQCYALLDDAAILIDAVYSKAAPDAKKAVSCRMICRAMATTDLSIPIGASQGSQSALGYSTSWTMGSGSTGELYLAKTDRQMLGGGNAIGARSPLEGMSCAEQ